MRKVLLLSMVLAGSSLTSGCLAVAAVGAAGAVVGTAAEVTIRTTGAVIGTGVDIVTPGDDDDDDKAKSED
jgi:hypothetical protein